MFFRVIKKGNSELIFGVASKENLSFINHTAAKAIRNTAKMSRGTTRYYYAITDYI